MTSDGYILTNAHVVPKSTLSTGPAHTACRARSTRSVRHQTGGKARDGYGSRCRRATCRPVRCLPR
ncbi:MAG: hypothetical protein IH965_12110 [Gemmatimonadetes bacterium]|nr:hypothetical protein [Gemmatimonadota bacterium]